MLTVYVSWYYSVQPAVCVCYICIIYVVGILLFIKNMNT